MTNMTVLKIFVHDLQSFQAEHLLVSAMIFGNGQEKSWYYIDVLENIW